MNAEDGVLWVVEVKESGAWAPAWDGEGATPNPLTAERWASELREEKYETRVVKYVRAEE